MGAIYSCQNGDRWPHRRDNGPNCDAEIISCARRQRIRYNHIDLNHSPRSDREQRPSKSTFAFWPPI